MARKDAKILVVDDNPRNIQVIGNILRDANYEVGFALDGQIALEQLHSFPDFDLVLLDVEMPILSGYELCSILKSDDRLREIPVIFLTLNEDNQNLEISLFNEGVDWICKPVKGKELLARVNTHLMLERKTRELTANKQEIENLKVVNEKFVAIIGRDLKPVFEGDRRLENVLTWTNTILGGFSYRPTLTALEDLIRNITMSYRIEASNKSIMLWYTAGPLPLSFRTDEKMFGLVLGYLLDNAIKFTKKDGKVDVSSEFTAEGVAISVTDTGMGIPDQEIERLFTIDGRIEARKGTADEQGSGLGLILCKSFLDKMGGTISVESEPDKGSRFTFTLPLK